MTPLAQRHKITPVHLGRKAVVYLRQSSERQVKENTESQRLQYGLAQRARELGWHEVEIIDTDLGRSAAIGAGPREGFERLVAAVALGEVGLVLSREVSRLSRTDKDWCHLLEVCQIFGTLIADADQSYDLELMDDQLVLGIKATLSIVELKVLKLRLLQGMEEKARRGALKRLLPVGYVWDGDQVVKDPNQRIQEAIALVFRKFRELASGRQTFLWFRTHGVELPVNKSRGGPMRVVWQLPTNSFLQNLLRDPSCAGAYVWGRRETTMTWEKGQLRKRQGRLRRAEHCRVYLRDHHEGYITWEAFEEHLQILRGNDLKGAGDAAVGLRAGQGLLAGLLRCGRCGRKLHVRYWGKSGTAARYLCQGAFGGGGDYCLGFGGRRVAERLGQALVEVLSPVGLRASLEAADRLCAREEDQRQALLRKLEQEEYEAARAFDQYNAVDPRHRLVAAELERRWQAKLEERDRLRGALAELDGAAQVLGERERARILALGTRFPEVWQSAYCPVELKKRILRTAVEEIVVNQDAAGLLRLVIHWTGGAHSQFEMGRPRAGREQKTALADIAVIRQLAVRYGDDAIAVVLNKLGRRTGKGKRWNAQRVRTARSTYAIPGHSRTVPDPEILTLGRAAKHCGVSQGTIMRLVNSGILPKHQVVPWAPWEIRRADLDSPEVQRVLHRLRETGKSGLQGVHSRNQQTLFESNQGDGNGRYYD
jgi:DNA invertase Pin-like site-specific DNA recombinase